MKIKNLAIVFTVILLIVSSFTLLPKSNGDKSNNTTTAMAAEGLRWIDLNTYAKELHFSYMNQLELGVAKWIGTPYRWGGNTLKGVDCSGFVRNVYMNNFGITLNRSSRDMYREVESIDRDELQPGDLVFFKRKRGPIYHVGIYLQNGNFAHASSGDRKVLVSSLDEAYYDKNFYAGGRVKRNNG